MLRRTGWHHSSASLGFPQPTSSYILYSVHYDITYFAVQSVSKKSRLRLNFFSSRTKVDMGNPGFVENVHWTDQLFLSRSGPWIFLRFIRSIIALSEKLKSPFMETLLRTCARSYLKSCWDISSLKKMNGRELFMQRGNNHPAGLWCLCCFEFYTHIVLHRRVCTVLQLQGFLNSPFLHWTWISVCLDSGTDV